MALAAARNLIRNRHLRALMVTWTMVGGGVAGYGVLLTVFVFIEGGTVAVAAVTVIRLLPGGLISPLAAPLGSSARPQLHLAASTGTRALVMVATTIAVLGGAPLWVVLVLAAVDSVGSAPLRPLHGALVVRLADSAAEAGAANAATGSLINGAGLVGPAIAGIALGFLGLGWSFMLVAAAFAIGAVSALLISTPDADDLLKRRPTRLSTESAMAQVHAVLSGFHAIFRSGPAFAAAALFFVNVMLVGVWFVTSAPIADDRLGLGSEGITTIMALTGAGGLVASLAMLSLVGRRGLAGVLAGAMICWAVALAAAGATDLYLVGFLMAVVIGAGTAIAHAIAPTLLQRSVARESMVPATASMFSVAQIGTALGAVIAILLVETVDVTVTLVAIGAVSALVTVLAWPLLRRASELSPDDAAKLKIIRATPILTPLPGLALEQLARAATHLEVAAGSEVIRQGDHGDTFYMIAAGIADVAVDGRKVATLGPGGSFGEIALLHDMPRTATVTAREDADLIVVDAAEFRSALSTDTDTVGRLGEVARARLATAPVETRLVERDRDDVLDGRSVVDLLRAQSLLARIDDDRLRELADAARVLSAPTGALITREGDHGDTFYVILDGAAEVVQGGKQVREIGPGDSFGDLSILRDLPQPASVQALSEVILIGVDHHAFEHARRAH